MLFQARPEACRQPVAVGPERRERRELVHPVASVRRVARQQVVLALDSLARRRLVVHPLAAAVVGQVSVAVVAQTHSTR